jgi:hypothetical protein
MTIRHRLSSYRKSNLSPVEKQEDVISFLYRIEDMINKKIEVNFFLLNSITNFILQRNVNNMLVILLIG